MNSTRAGLRRSEYARRHIKKNTWSEIYKHRVFLLLLLPGFLYYIIFHYIPMYGIYIGFINYKPNASMTFLQSVLGSEWVGLAHIMRFLQGPKFFLLIKNTILLSFYSLLFGFPAPIIFALLLNEVRNKQYRKTIQTLSTFPHYLSMVTVVGMMVMILSPTTGVMGSIFRALGLEPVYFMASSQWFRTLYVGSGIWQGIGWGAIIYIAAISRISVDLYESAHIDGANRFQHIWHITLPSIAPTIIILLILAVGRLISASTEKILLMYSPITYDVADVIGTYIYRRGLQDLDFSLATAVGLFNSAVNLLLLMAANAVARRVSEYSLW
jgi:putative aldouronate transport system permease protein